MREVDQKLLELGIHESFDENDYYVSKSNYFAKNIIDTWPKWEKKIVNLTGEKYSGKTHLSTIFKTKTGWRSRHECKDWHCTRDILQDLSFRHQTNQCHTAF